MIRPLGVEIPRPAERIRRSDVSNLTQVYTELKYTSKENMRSSQELLDGLERQGFMRNG